MDNQDAYRELARTLDEYRAKPYSDLLRLVGAAPQLHCVVIQGDEVTIEVRVSRDGQRANCLHIEAAALGPSCWRLERMEKHATVAPTEEP